MTTMICKSHSPLLVRSGEIGFNEEDIHCEIYKKIVLIGRYEKNFKNNYRISTILLNIYNVYELVFSKQVKKVLATITTKVSRKILKELQKIAKAPKLYTGDWKKLKGSDFWRLRKGGWRVICEMIDSELVILVLKVGSR